MRFIRILLFLAIVVSCQLSIVNSLWAQVSYSMTSSTISIDACHNPTGTIYDDGGLNGQYTSNFDGWVVVTASQGVTITLTGDYNTESNYDKIWVYDWDAHMGTSVPGGNTLVDGVSGNSSINVASSTGLLSIHFTTDNSVTRDGFALTYSIGGTGAACNNQITNLTASGITTNSASLSWSATTPSSSYLVTINGTPQTVSTNSLSLNTLNPNTYYDVVVVDNSDIGSACCQARTSFRTPCGVMSAPVIEYFDDHGTGTSVMPSCWARQYNYDDADERYPQLQSIQSVSSPASLFMFCGNNDVAGHWSLAIGPEIGDDIASLFVRFHIRATNTNARIEVGVCNDTSLYDNNFSPVDTITVTEANTWQQKVANHLSRYTGTGRHIAFRMMRSLQPGNSVTIYIDNLIIEPCGVWQISRQERSTNDFYVQWTNIGAPIVNIEIGPVDFVPGTGTMHSNVTSPYHFTGLESGTTYQLRFYTNCNGITREQTGINATTLARDARVLDFCEGFEDNGDNVPVGWRRPTTYSSTPQASTSANYSGSRGLYFRPYYASTKPIAVIPLIDTVDIDQLTVSFMLRSYYNSGFIEVGVMEYPEYAGSFVPVDTVSSSTAWTMKKVSLHSYYGNGNYIAFRAYDPNNSGNYIYLDNLKVGTCLVTGEQVTNIASHRVEVHWDTVGPHFHGDSVTVEYGSPGFTPGSGTIVRTPVTGSGVQTVGDKQRLTINGLAADTDYEFVVYGDCDHTVQHCLFSHTAHTLEADIALPYCQQFDGYATGGLPAGWSRPVMYDSRPRIWNSNNRSGDRSLQLRSYGYLSDNHSLVVMPMFDVDSVRGMTVSFYSYGTRDNNYNPRIQVGVMDNPNDESTFTAVATATPQYNSWKSHVVDLGSYTGTGKYIAFRYYHNDCSWCSDDVYIDDIVVSDAATSSRSVYSITSHGATFKWLPRGRAYNGAVIEWGPVGFTQGSSERWGADTIPANVAVDANGYYHYSLDTLQSGTAYNFFITALSSACTTEVCSICNYTRQSFTTAAEPLQSSYCYGFDDLADETYPWNYSWYRPLRYEAEPRATTDAHSAPYAMYLRSYYNNNNPQYRSMAVMPVLEEESLDGLTLRFWAKGSGSNSRFEVGMVSDPNDAGTFQLLSTFVINHGDWRQYSVDLSQYTGSSRHIAFLHYSLPTWESGWVYFDDITISRCNVTNVRTFSHTTTSFTIDWTTNGTVDSVEIEYGPQGFTPGTGTTFNSQLSTFNFQNLTPSTTYDFYIRPYCTGSGSACSEAKYTTSTLATPVAAGYCEGFEGYNTYQRPQHWTTLASFGDHPFIYNHSESQYYTSPISAFEFRSDASNSNLIVMPAAEEDISGLILSFNIRCSDQYLPDRPSLIIGAMTNPLDASTFVPIDTVHPSFSYRPVSIDLSTLHQYTNTPSHQYTHIAFRYIDDGSRYTYIDDITLSHCHITNLQASQVTDTSALLSWSTLGNSDSTWIAYDTLGGNFSNTSSMFQVPSSNPTLNSQLSTFNFNNLLPDHTYTFRLWGSCQDSLSECQATTIDVTTLSSPLTIPLCEGFESFADGSIPRGWTLPVDVPNTSVSTIHHDGNRSLRLTTRGGAYPLSSFAVMPIINSDIDTLYLDAYLSSDFVPTSLTVGFMTDPNDTTTFTPVESFETVPSAWRHIKCPIINSQFSIPNSQFPYIAFRTTGGDNNMRYVYLDDINLRSCSVTSVRTSNPTETSITLSWNTTSDDLSVVIEYKATGQNAGDFAPGTGTIIDTIHHSPFTINDLQEATNYTFHIYPVCNGVYDGCNYDIVSMQTLHPWVDLPYCENFESISTALPNNWLNLSSDGYPYRNYTYYGHDETATSYTTLYASSTDSSLFVLPRVYLGSRCPILDRLYANFWTLFSGNVSQALLEIGVMSDANDPSTFVAHDTVLPNADSWQHNIKSINNYNTSSSYIAFRLRSLDGSGVYCDFDDLCLEKCVATDVSVSEVTQNSITITWNNYSVDTLICEYGPAGYPLGSGTVVTITESPYLLTGLADGSEYEFTFATLCGCDQYGTAYTPGGGSWGGSGGWGGWGWGWYCCAPCHYDTSQPCRIWRWGSWTGHSWSWWYSQGGSGNWVTPPVIDVTTQAAMLETPYCESFEIADTLPFPPSWRRKAESHYPDISRVSIHNGEKSMRFYATPGSSCYAALPPLEMGVTSSMVMTFYAYSTNNYATSDDARFIVGVMNNPDNLTSFTPIDTIRLNATSKWQQQTVNFASYSGEGQYIAFLFAPVGAAYNFFIDDLYLSPCAISDVCVVPDAGTATVSWTSHNTPDRVLIQYGPQGASPETADSLFRYEYAYYSPYSVIISPDSSYDFYVSSICNDTATGSCLVEPITVNPSLLLPYCETFDRYENGLLPERWKVVQRNSSLPQYPLTETQHGDHQILAFYPSNGANSNIILLPPLPYGDSLAGKWVNVVMASSNSSYIFLDFGYLSDTNNPSSFVQMATVNNSTAEQLQQYNFQLTIPSGLSNGNRLALRARSTSGSRWIRLDRLVVSNSTMPIGISSTAHGVAERIISWSGGLESCTLEYGYDGEQWQTAAAVSRSATLTGLLPDKDYEVFFVSAGGERLCIPYTFHNEGYVDLTYCDDFSSYGYGDVPSGWVRYHSRSGWVEPRVESAEIDFRGYSSDICQIAMPDIAIDSIRHAELMFRLYSERYDYNALIIGVMEHRNGYSTFVPVDTVRNTVNNSYQYFHLNLSRYQGSGRYITFRLLCSSSSYRLYMDDLTVSPCPLPDFTVVGSTTVKASVPRTSDVDYYIEYAQRSFTQGEQDTLWNTDHSDFTLSPFTTIVHVTQNPFYIEGLNPATTYFFYARCDSLTPTCAAPVTLTTAERLPLPYCENFDACDNLVVPQGWHSYSSYGDNYPRTYDACYYSCCRTLDFYSNRDHLQYTAMPDFDIDSIRHLDLTFSLRIENISYTKLVVGVMDNPLDFSTFSPVDTLTCAANSTHYAKHLSLAKYNGSGRFIAFRILTTYSSRTSIFIDDLRIQSCPKPTVALSAGTTVRFDVDTSTQSPDYWIEYGPEGFSQLSEDTLWNADSTAFSLQPQGTIVHVSESPFFISGLDENSTYDFFSRCDSAVATCLPAHRITTSMKLSLPFCYNLSDYNGLPPCWIKYNNNSYSNEYPVQYDSWHLRFYNYTYNKICQVSIPDFDIDSIKNIYLEFRLYVDYTNDGMIVGVMDNPNDISTFTPVDTLYCTSTQNWYWKTPRMWRYNGSGRFITFRALTSNNYRSVYFADLTLQSCPKPTVTLSAATTVRFDVDTTAQNPDYWIEYGPEGITQLAEDTLWNADSSAFSLLPHNTLIHVTESPFFISGLDANTSYDFFSRCDSALSTCFPVTSITTMSTHSLPYCESFSGYGSGSNAFPTDWRRHVYDNDGSYLYVYNDGDAEDSRSLRFYTYSSRNSYAVLPEIDDVDISSLFIHAKMWSQSGANVSTFFLQVGVMTNPYDIGTFRVVDTLRNSASGQWEDLSASLARYDGEGRFIAFRMRETNGYWRSIYLDRIEVLSCDIPADVSATLHGSRTIRINAPEPTTTGFLVEYGPQNFSQGEGTIVQINQLPSDLELEYSTSYDFYFRCDSTNVTCRPKQTVTTAMAPSPLPYCEGFESYSRNGYPPLWNKKFSNSNNGSIYVYDNSDIHSGTKALHFSTYYNYRDFAVLPDFQIDSLNNLAVSFWLKTFADGTSMTLGVLSDPNDINTFSPVRSFSSDNAFGRQLVMLNALPGDARYLAFRTSSPNSCCTRYLCLDDLYIDTVGAADFRITAIESDEVTFSWNQVGHPAITIEYGPIGFTRGTGTTISLSQFSILNSQFSISGLDPLTSYKFYFDAVSQPGSTSFCNTNYSDSATIFTPAGGTGCIDPTNLTAAYTTCFYGTYGNPYANIGIVDYGSDDIRSRHAVHYDATATDPRTGGLLHIVPDGADASVRLGNWNSNSSSAEGEAITYTLFVDTTAFDLLVLKYAAVLQDPLHAPSDQPRFSLEVLDSNNTLLDAQCAAADFIANRNLGWNQASGGVLWKDWTTVGVDMSPYAGQTVRIRLTTRDCGEGNHYGYSYFTLGCMMKNMRSELCGDVDSNTFYAPAGFAYRWYSSEDPSVTISTAQSLKVASDTVTYYCQCSFVDNASCSFTISAYAGTRYPLALFDYNVEVHDCKFYVSFSNNSTISADGINPLGSGEGCESALWDFGDGQGSSNYNATHIYDHPGSYNVTLVSGIADNACSDTALLTISLAFTGTSYNLSGDSYICLGDSASLTLSGAYSFVWSDGSDAETRTFVPDTTSLYSVAIIDSNGCADTLAHTVTVFPVSHNNVYKTTVENNLPYNYIGNLYAGDTIDTIALTNFAGCDSIVYFQLHVFRNVSASVDSTICESSLPLHWNNRTFYAAGTLADTLTTTHGADSLLTMTLHIIPTTLASIFDTIVENQLPYTWNGHTFAGDSSIFNFKFSTFNFHGCDSIITYSLFVHRNVYDTIDSTVCQSALPFSWNGHTFDGDSLIFNYQFSILNSHGADSIITMRLTVIPTTYATLSDTIVENQLPYSWNGHTFAGDSSIFNFQFSIINYHGCDSLISFSLFVHRNIFDTIDSLICPSALPMTWNDSIFSSPGTKATLLSAASGADSVVVMNLSLYPVYHWHDTSTVCRNTLPFQWRDTTIADLDTTLSSFIFHLSALSSHGCDSLMSLYLTVANPVDIFDSVAGCASIYNLAWRDTMININYSSHLPDAPDRLMDFTLHRLTSHGCDSNIHLHLTTYPIYDIHDSARICENSLPYSWRDTTISSFDPTLTSYILHLTSTSVHLCDSSMHLHLTVDTNTHATIFDTIVENQLPYTWNGHTFAGDSSIFNFQFSTFNFHGCDSIISYSLTVYRNVSTSVDSTVCQSELPFTWNGHTFDGDSLIFNYQFTILNSHGADSIVNMTLHVNPSYHTDETLQICRDALPLTWHDSIIDNLDPSLTSYIFHLTSLTSDGCDSSFSLALTVKNLYNVDDSIESCNPITWIDGITYSASVYGPQVTLPSVDGCDSVVTLVFTLSDPTFTNLVDSFCSGTPYFFAGNEITSGGIYYDTLQTIHHCDSIVALDLTRLETPVIDIEYTADCGSLTYNIFAFSSVDYLHWSASFNDASSAGVPIPWNPNWGPDNGNHLLFRHNKPVALTMTADYLPVETCPASKTFTLNPIVQPLAQMEVSPDFLNYDIKEVVAFDRSSAPTSIQWWVDGNNLGGDDHIVITLDIWNDSLLIMLVALTEQCSDTALHIVPIFRNSVYAPNAFTPDESSNREFMLKMDGIIYYELTIYNRQGLLVYEGRGNLDEGSYWSAPWDGTYKGKPCPQGNYVWILSYTTKETPRIPQVMKGSVLLIR